ncbi:hypothetical protein [Acidicapsa ligni]|uniref:hypothetical protein n=1 Tax=Acidicapsa ligni TaxID=542300 RepID=UPI0021E08BF5|nr:hypothetical protein [Acidicapsa ligni]
MVLSSMQVSSTQICGVVGYGMSLLACAVAWIQYNKSGRRESWLTAVAIAQLLLLLDMIFNWRWMLHEFWMRRAQSEGVYQLRRSPQLIALLVLAAAVIGVVIWVSKRFRGMPAAAMATVGTLLSVGLWCAETLSYHYLDAVFHAMLGGVMAIGLLWLGLGLFTSFGLLKDSRRF